MSSKNFQEAIRERLQAGFSEWNSGYDAWLKWCDTLYEPDAVYNIGMKDSLSSV